MTRASADASDEPVADLATRAKALSVPLRWRVLRLCVHEERTNRELATILDVNPATMLHHVRTLVGAGYLEALPARRGTRGAREIPYVATRLAWTEHDKPASSDVLLRAFIDEVQGLDPEILHTMRIGLLLTDAERDELIDRIWAIVQEYAGAHGERRSRGDRTPWSLFQVVHPDTQQG